MANDEQVFILTQKVGRIEGLLEQHLKSYSSGKQANISVQKEMLGELKVISAEMPYKMDKRENRFLVFINTLAVNWKWTLAVFAILSGSGLALTWEEVLKLFGVGH